jgi:hypothetical protein
MARSSTKYILQRTLQLAQHPVQSTQGDALFTPLQSENGGRWKPHLL